jgi:hypothetical protein
MKLRPEWLKRSLLLSGLVVGLAALAPTASQARVFVNFGFPAIAAFPPPIVYAPPPVVYAPPVAYAAPRVFYPPVVYPARVYGRGVYYGHPYWHRRWH